MNFNRFSCDEIEKKVKSLANNKSSKAEMTLLLNGLKQKWISDAKNKYRNSFQYKVLYHEMLHAISRLVMTSYNIYDDGFKQKFKEIICKETNFKHVDFILFDDPKSNTNLQKFVATFCKITLLKGREQNVEKLISRVRSSRKPMNKKYTCNNQCIIVKCVAITPRKKKEESTSSVFGVLLITHDMGACQWMSEEKEFVRTLAKFFCLIYEFNLYHNELKKRAQIDYEFKLAVEIQQKLLPKKFPASDNLEFYGYNHSLRIVGGDFYSVICKDKSHYKCIIGDVCGKGLQAALMVNRILSQFHVIHKEKLFNSILLKKFVDMVLLNTKIDDKNMQKALIQCQREKKPSEVMGKLNLEMFPFIEDDSFITMQYAVFDTVNSVLLFSNAGHLPILYYCKANNSFIGRGCPAPPLGIAEKIQYHDEAIAYNFGDIFVFYTDGVIEASKFNATHHSKVKREFFGFNRLGALIQENCDLSAREITKNVIKCVNDFADGKIDDDITVLVVKVKKC